MFWLRKKRLPTVAFATTCWESDWRTILHDPEYSRVAQIARHRFSFSEKILIINNVNDLDLVKKAAQQKIDDQTITRYVSATEIADEILNFFQLKRSDFQPKAGVSADWIYYNSLAPLAAIYSATADYLL